VSSLVSNQGCVVTKASNTVRTNDDSSQCESAHVLEDFTRVDRTGQGEMVFN